MCAIYVFASLYIGALFTADYTRNAENYLLEVDSKDLIEEIDSLKKKLDYNLIKVNEDGKYVTYPDTYSENGRYYQIYFYIPENNYTLRAVIRVNKSSEDKVVFALCSVSEGVNFASWKSINTEELSTEENKKIKKKFEIEILDRLGKWKHKRWYN